MSGYRTLLVAGTHGKTSTTSMAVAALQHSGADPSFAVGGELNERAPTPTTAAAPSSSPRPTRATGHCWNIPRRSSSSLTSRPTTSTSSAARRPTSKPFDKFVGGVESGGVVGLRRRPRVRAMLERTEEALTANDVSVWGYGHHVGGGAQRPTMSSRS